MRTFLFICLSILPLIYCQDNSNLGISDEPFRFKRQTNAVNPNQKYQKLFQIYFPGSKNEPNVGVAAGTTSPKDGDINQIKKNNLDRIFSNMLLQDARTTSTADENIDERLKNILDIINSDNQMSQNASTTPTTDENIKQNMKKILDVLFSDKEMSENVTTNPDEDNRIMMKMMEIISQNASTTTSDKDEDAKKLLKYLELIYYGDKKWQKDTSTSLMNENKDQYLTFMQSMFNRSGKQNNDDKNTAVPPIRNRNIIFPTE